jgi:hypothetical protein
MAEAKRTDGKLRFYAYPGHASDLVDEHGRSVCIFPSSDERWQEAQANGCHLADCWNLFPDSLALAEMVLAGGLLGPSSDKWKDLREAAKAIIDNSKRRMP